LYEDSLKGVQLVSYALTPDNVRRRQSKTGMAERIRRPSATVWSLPAQRLLQLL
jgi:hypothetical protein